MGSFNKLNPWSCVLGTGYHQVVEEFLQDETALIDERFYIVGRQDKSEEYANDRATMQELTADLDPDKFSIVLDHQPAEYEAQKESGVDLVLSGYTHGGQLFPLINIE